jgi:hypothetical protein
MNSRERIKMALNHRQPDKVPVDFNGTTLSGISAGALDRLRKAMKLEYKPVKVYEPFQIIGWVEDDLLKAFNADVIGLHPLQSTFGYKNQNWKPWKLQNGTDVLVGEGFTVKENERGDLYLFPQGDISAQPSAMLPKGGFYFDNITRQEPYDADNLNGREDFKEHFCLLGDEELKHLEKESINLYNNTEYAITGNVAIASLGDVAQLPGPNLKKTPGIRKIDEWYMAHLMYPNYIKEIFEFQTEIGLKNLKLIKEAVGNRIESIFISGADYGTQKSEFISPDLFREFYKPNFRKLNDWVHKNTGWKTFYHCCGSIVNLLDDFVDMGVDILNPVQTSAEGMSPKFLKDKYGDKLTFWGGAIDTQKTLPFGTPEDVRKEALERIEIFSKNGGFVFAPIHNIQQPTPIENILAFYNTAKEYNNRLEK